MANPEKLTGHGILVTRPAHQAENLCQLIESSGGCAWRFPTLAIVPALDLDFLAKLLTQSWDLLYFVSRNAVEHALAITSESIGSRVLKIAAVGRATAQALSAAGRAPDLFPKEKYESEALLALPDLAELTGRRVLIVRGEGGRALFGETLSARGAEVHYAEVYRRVLPEINPAPLLAVWKQKISCVTVTSEEILVNLIKLLGPAGQQFLFTTPLVVVAERTAQTAKQLGFTQIQIAARAEDAAILQAICEILNINL